MRFASSVDLRTLRGLIADIAIEYLICNFNK